MAKSATAAKKGAAKKGTAAKKGAAKKGTAAKKSAKRKPAGQEVRPPEPVTSTAGATGKVLGMDAPSNIPEAFTNNTETREGETALQLQRKAALTNDDTKAKQFERAGLPGSYNSVNVHETDPSRAAKLSTVQAEQANNEILKEGIAKQTYR